MWIQTLQKLNSSFLPLMVVSISCPHWSGSLTSLRHKVPLAACSINGLFEDTKEASSTCSCVHNLCLEIKQIILYPIYCCKNMMVVLTLFCVISVPISVYITNIVLVWELCTFPVFPLFLGAYPSKQTQWLNLVYTESDCF